MVLGIPGFLTFEFLCALAGSFSSVARGFLTSEFYK